MRRCHLKNPLMTSLLFQGHQKQQTETINRKLFENASSPIFAFFSKIIRFYFIGVFPDFLDTLYVAILHSTRVRKFQYFFGVCTYLP
jgi:hypothetical protein